MASDPILPSHPTSSELTGGGSRQTAAVPKSFAAAARTAQHGFFRPIQLVPRQYGSKEGCPAISFTSSEIQEGASRLQHSLVAKFSGGRPHIEEVRKVFSSVWDLQGEASIGAWDARHVLVILKSEQDACRVLASSTRKVNNYWFRLFRWSPDFHTKKEPTLTTSWVRLMALPPHLYDTGITKSIVSSFGKFIGVDERTKQFSNPSFARVCVELDLANSIPEKVWISSGSDPGFWLHLVFENNLFYCQRCKLHGHQALTCRKLRTAAVTGSNVQSIPQPNSDPKAQPKKAAPANTEVQNQEEGWQVPRRRHRARIQKDAAINDAAVEEGVLASVSRNTEVIPGSDIPDVNMDDASAAKHSNAPMEESQVANVDNNALRNKPMEDHGHGSSNASMIPQGHEIVIYNTVETNGAEVENVLTLDSHCNDKGKEVVAYEEEASEPKEADVLEPKVARKIAKYGSHIFTYDQGSPINARDFFLGMKAHYGDTDAHILRVMEIVYNEAMQAMNEGSNSAVEASDGSIDLSRIIKNPRQKSKGTRRSGRSCPKKRDSNFVY